MKRSTVRRALILLALLIVSAALFLGFQSHRRPAVTPYQALLLPAAAAAPGELRVRFAGVSSLLFDDGETAWMTDGFFSRPSLAAMFGRIAPDQARIGAGLQSLGVGHLAAVIPLHSHYDHAMDAPVVARLTGALLIGSASTLQIGRGYGLAEGAMREIKPGDSLQLGKFKLSFLKGRHSPTAWSDGITREDIEAPLTPPAPASAWREGQVWSLLVEHGGRTLLVQASAGYVPDALKDVKADVVLLGVGTLGKKDSAYLDAYWAEVVQLSGARRVIPIHWDDFWLPLPREDGGILPALPYLIDDFGRTMSELQARADRDRRELRLPPLRSLFNPFAGVPPR
ncbi:MBL fold metallo-hydrolase [soil metagenome]